MFTTYSAVVSCMDFSRPQLESLIYVNHKTLDLFVGEEAQLIANPQNDRVYEWICDNTEVASVDNSGLVTALMEGMASVTVESEGKTVTVPVTVKKKVATTDVELSEYNVSMFTNTSVKITAKSVPEDANDIAKTDYSWTSADESVAMVDSNGEIMAISKGQTVVTYRKGNFTKEVSVTVAKTLPFLGPHIVSDTKELVLPMKNFDIGGPDNAYHDSDDVNSFGTRHREDNGDINSPGVDIYHDGCIASIYGGEWLLFSIQVETPGTYGIQVSTAGPAVGKIDLEIDEIHKSGSLVMPTSGNWSVWKWGPEQPYEVELVKGTHTIKVILTEPTFNVNELKVNFIK